MTDRDVIKELKVLRQSSLDEFVFHGGKLSNVTQNVITNNKQLTFDNVLHKLPNAIWNKSHPKQSSVASFIKNVMLQGLNNIPIIFEKGVDPYSATRLNQHGIRLIRFDSMGVLFAVAGLNGMIRIFDFDECIGRMQRKEFIQPIECVLCIDTGKEISNFIWHPTNKDQLIVTHSFSSNVIIYDISTDLSPNKPKHIIEVGREITDCGHQTAVIWTPSILSKGPHLLAASPGGFIRCWNLSNPTAMKRCIWSLPSIDTCPILHLHILDNRWLISLNVHGFYCVHDLLHLHVPSFGQVATPKLIGSLRLVPDHDTSKTIQSVDFDDNYQYLITSNTGSVSLYDMSPIIRSLIKGSPGKASFSPTVFPSTSYDATGTILQDNDLLSHHAARIRNRLTKEYQDYLNERNQSSLLADALFRNRILLQDNYHAGAQFLPWMSNCAMIGCPLSYSWLSATKVLSSWTACGSSLKILDVTTQARKDRKDMKGSEQMNNKVPISTRTEVVKDSMKPFTNRPADPCTGSMKPHGSNIKSNGLMGKSERPHLDLFTGKIISQWKCKNNDIFPLDIQVGKESTHGVSESTMTLPGFIMHADPSSSTIVTSDELEGYLIPTKKMYKKHLNSTDLSEVIDATMPMPPNKKIRMDPEASIDKDRLPLSNHSSSLNDRKRSSYVWIDDSYHQQVRRSWKPSDRVKTSSTSTSSLLSEVRASLYHRSLISTTIPAEILTATADFAPTTSSNTTTTESITPLTLPVEGQHNQLYQVESMLNKNTIVLDRPYHGPKVVNGIPKIFLRSNLIQDYHTEDDAKTIPTAATTTENLLQDYHLGGWPVSKEILIQNNETVWQCPKRAQEYEGNGPAPVNSRVATFIMPHPTLPYIVVGMSDNGVVILTFES